VLLRAVGFLAELRRAAVFLVVDRFPVDLRAEDFFFAGMDDPPSGYARNAQRVIASPSGDDKRQ
jgi:hypothetical protein